MANPYFEFKQFTVWQDKCAMKVGTDGVLLGAWADTDNVKTILDIGTGTGLIALMLAQRSGAGITAIEIDENACLQARENINRSPWKERIRVIHTNFTTYAPGTTFDLIVCNPPYFIDSLKSSDASRSVARHNQELTYGKLLNGVSALLNPAGRFVVIIPTDVCEHVTQLASVVNLHPDKRLNIKTTPGKPPKRALIAFRFAQRICQTNELLIELERHCYSNEFTDLAKDFYLKL